MVNDKKMTAPRHITKDAIYAELMALKQEQAQQEDSLTVFSTRIRKSTKEAIRKARLTTGESTQSLTEKALRAYLEDFLEQE